ncbi:hypothetical protein L1049_015609 [Liquidambar formosana]|uniref:Uncharacterized protein n=1 Tax=Liquidambar formosana TaxID=63359 RepID=A0AAP0X202_LIQFO
MTAPIDGEGAKGMNGIKVVNEQIAPQVFDRKPNRNVVDNTLVFNKNLDYKNNAHHVFDNEHNKKKTEANALRKAIVVNTSLAHNWGDLLDEESLDDEEENIMPMNLTTTATNETEVVTHSLSSHQVCVQQFANCIIESAINHILMDTTSKIVDNVYSPTLVQNSNPVTALNGDNVQSWPFTSQEDLGAGSLATKVGGVETSVMASSFWMKTERSSERETFRQDESFDQIRQDEKLQIRLRWSVTSGGRWKKR